jgi:hypothetical protein
MDLQWLRDNGGIVPQTPVTREVSWTHPGPDGQDVTDTFTVRVKKLSAGAIERLYAESGKRTRTSYSATMIAETIVLGEEGDERLTYEQAFDLDPTLAEVLLRDAVHHVNPVRRRSDEAKN